MRGASDRVSFEQFVQGSSSWMLALAMLLTGHNRADAEDLLQTVLERAYRRWRRICRDGDPAPYVRQMLVNAAVDRWRLLRRRPELPLGPGDGGPAGFARPDGFARPYVAVTAPGLARPDASAAVANQDLLWRALARLPAGQRAVLVLRYYEDLTEAQTAAVLGCSVGSVKTQASRALARLRGIVAEADGADGPPVGAGQNLPGPTSGRGATHG